MNNSAGIFNLNRTAILAGIISATFSLHAMASAGKVEFALGGASLLRNDGSSRQISKGDEINPGDTIKTTDGRVQVRFTDGGYMSFQPNTEFKVEDYSYSGKQDGTEKAFFRLIEGGLRAITGVVGHANKPNYKVSTPVATIGIRGSEYLAEFRGSLRAHCNHGSIYVFNDQGNLILFRGQTAVVGNGAPSYGDNIEGIGARGPSNTNTAYNQEGNDNYLNSLYRNGDLRNEDGSLLTLNNTGPLGFAYAGEGGGPYTISDYNNGPTDYSQTKVNLNGNSLVNIQNFYASGSNASVETFTPTTGSSTQDYGHYGVLTWLRIQGSVEDRVDESYTSGSSSYTSSYLNQPLDNPHLIFGNQTSSQDLDSLRSNLASLNGYVANYTFVGGTNPTDSNGNVGKLTGGSFTADFGKSEYNGGLSLNMPTGNAAGSYTASFSGSIGGAAFSTNGFVSGSNSGSIYVSGFFAGANAAQVGLSYKIYTSDIISGVAGFTKSSTSPSVPTTSSPP